jgi:hypothetical protein
VVAIRATALDIGGILTSLLWFLAGTPSFSNRQPRVAIFWQSIAVFIIVVMCGWAVVEKEWFGLFFGMAVLFIETALIRQTYVTLRGHGRVHTPQL